MNEKNKAIVTIIVGLLILLMLFGRRYIWYPQMTVRVTECKGAEDER